MANIRKGRKLLHTSADTTLTMEELLPIFESISDAVFIDSTDGRCLWCNGACEEMYHVDMEDIQGRHVDELEAQGIFSPSVTKRVLDEKREITIIHENRMGKRLLTTGTPVFAGGAGGAIAADDRIALVVTTSRDITGISKGVADATLFSAENLTTSDRGRSSRASKMVSTSTLAPRGGFGSHHYNAGEAGSKLVTASRAMQNVVALSKRLATVNSTVLITGESGVGKGLIAKTLHEEGSRWKEPFVTVNCGAIPENLIESELFGYVAGAFTGARSGGKKGLFEAAQGGTIFLDEISELPLDLQVKLLQVIQERKITPVGGVKPIPIDVRIISATNRDLESLVKEGRFREDLYYRLNVVPINVPPLRNRQEDIMPLIMINLQRLNKEMGTNKQISEGALDILLKYPWPGNIRELQNIVERLMITTAGDVIEENNISAGVRNEAAKNAGPVQDTSLTAALEQAERNILEQAVKEHGSTRAIAKALHTSQPTIVRKLRKHGLSTTE